MIYQFEVIVFFFASMVFYFEVMENALPRECAHLHNNFKHKLYKALIHSCYAELIYTQY